VTPLSGKRLGSGGSLLMVVGGYGLCDLHGIR